MILLTCNVHTKIGMGKVKFEKFPKSEASLFKYACAILFLNIHCTHTYTYIYNLKILK